MRVILTIFVIAAGIVAIVGILTDSNYRATYKYSRRNKLNND